MRALVGLSVIMMVAISAYASSVHYQTPEHLEKSGNSQAHMDSHHGSRTKRSPLDPVVAPLLIGKSFLYGALLGPKLFRPYYYHYKPHFHHGPHYGHFGYGRGWGWGHYGK